LARDYSIDVVKRAFSLLETLANSEVELGIKDIAQSIGISSNSAFRLLFTLESLGYVHKNPEIKKYGLDIGLFRLGNAVIKNKDINNVARPLLRELLNSFQETVNLAVLHGIYVVYIERLESPMSLRTSNAIGSRAPAYSTSLGKAILAYQPISLLKDVISKTNLERVTPKTITNPQILEQELDKIRQRGYSVDDEENVTGVYCIGAPIFSALNRAEAAISISAPVQRLSDPEKREDIGTALIRVAREISIRMGYK